VGILTVEVHVEAKVVSSTAYKHFANGGRNIFLPLRCSLVWNSMSQLYGVCQMGLTCICDLVIMGILPCLQQLIRLEVYSYY